ERNDTVEADVVAERHPEGRSEKRDAGENGGEDRAGPPRRPRRAITAHSAASARWPMCVTPLRRPPSLAPRRALRALARSPRPPPYFVLLVGRRGQAAPQQHGDDQREDDHLLVGARPKRRK